jgi:hypothetical protein
MTITSRAWWVWLALIAAASSPAFGGPKWEIADDSYIQLGALGQVHGSFTENAADEHDLYLRRARIILSGQVVDGVKFFMETDNDNAGRSGTSDVSTDIQDAFVEQRIVTNHYVQGGLILLPFSFENASSAGSLLGLDYNLETLKFAETFAWRDYGVVFRGDFGKRVAYRLGAFDGYDDKAGTKNPDAKMRGTGHIAVNLLGETETGWFFTQERLGDKPYLALGVGTDQQKDATRIVSTNGPALIVDNEAFVIDFQSGFPAGALFATVNGGWYTWDNAQFEGDTAFLEAGLRFGDFQVTCKQSRQEPDGLSSIDDTTVGFHHFRKKHQARAGVEYRWGDTDSQALVGFQISL